jgi:hypothetical protein
MMRTDLKLRIGLVLAKNFNLHSIMISQESVFNRIIERFLASLEMTGGFWGDKGERRRFDRTNRRLSPRSG